MWMHHSFINSKWLPLVILTINYSLQNYDKQSLKLGDKGMVITWHKNMMKYTLLMKQSHSDVFLTTVTVDNGDTWLINRVGYH